MNEYEITQLQRNLTNEFTWNTIEKHENVIDAINKASLLGVPEIEVTIEASNQLREYGFLYYSVILYLSSQKVGVSRILCNTRILDWWDKELYFMRLKCDELEIIEADRKIIDYKALDTLLNINSISLSTQLEVSGLSNATLRLGYYIKDDKQLMSKLSCLKVPIGFKLNIFFNSFFEVLRELEMLYPIVKLCSVKFSTVVMHVILASVSLEDCVINIACLYDWKVKKELKVEMECILPAKYELELIKKYDYENWLILQHYSSHIKILDLWGKPMVFS